MHGTSKCIRCNKEFKWRRGFRQVVPKFCSMDCAKPTAEEKKETLIFTFEKDVIRKDGCWEWKGCKDKNGCPLISCRPDYSGTKRASRVSWILHNGPIPKGKIVMHMCDNPICTNPNHLRLGTNMENSQDMIAKKRQALGSKNPNAKLDEIKVKEIKKLILDGLSYPKIAKLFCVGADTISNIKRGKIWKHVGV